MLSLESPPLVATSLVARVREAPGEAWDEFLATCGDQPPSRRTGWLNAVHSAFAWPLACIEVRDGAERIQAVLPLVRQPDLLSGPVARSLPYFTYGGVTSRSAEALDLALRTAIGVTEKWRCRTLEIRSEHLLRGLEWTQVGKDKVSMRLELPSSFEELSKRLGSKLRSQAKRADREGAEVRIGRADLLDDFYTAFCANMRDLGTPVYPKRFFDCLLHHDPGSASIIVVYRHGKPAASAFITISGEMADIPWAACTKEAKPLGFNMRLYWEVLQYVVTRNCRIFDFGRTSTGSPTFKFKAQWGAEPVQLYWHRMVLAGSQAPARGDATSSTAGMAVRAWQRLPLWLANRLGPLISPRLPW
jgi:serine/alanine adding enzyme